MNEPIKAQKAIVVFFDSLTIEGYKMPNGDFRVGLEGASLILGYSDKWLPRVVENKFPTTLAKLEDIGFTRQIVPVSAKSNQSNVFTDRTISLDDFQCCIIYAVQNKKRAAIALNKGFTKLALIDFFRDAFGDPPLTIDEKRELFYQEYASTISPERWREMDRQDIINLALAGDEPQLKDGLWNDSEVGEE